MMAKPMKTLELHYLTIQFLEIFNILVHIFYKSIKCALQTLHLLIGWW